MKKSSEEKLLTSTCLAERLLSRLRQTQRRRKKRSRRVSLVIAERTSQKFTYRILLLNKREISACGKITAECRPQKMNEEMNDPRDIGGSRMESGDIYRKCSGGISVRKSDKPCFIHRSTYPRLPMFVCLTSLTRLTFRMAAAASDGIDTYAGQGNLSVR